MIGKTSRKMFAVYAFFSTFFVVLLTMFSYFYAAKVENWLAELTQQKVFYVPLVVHIFLLSVIVGFVTFLIISFIQKMDYGRIEEKLRLLANGNYEHARLEKTLANESKDDDVKAVDQDILLIRKKMLEMSKELQLLMARPQLVDGETKEGILEDERHRLARELHDSVSQQLFAAMMMLSALDEQINQQEVAPAFKQQLHTIVDIISASQSEMRALLLHLRPISLEGKNLRQGIEQLLKELQTKIKIGLTWDVEDVHLHSSIEDHLFRIVQELLSNTLRHAKAKELEVYLHRVNETILLRVVDDGVGFDMSENEEKVGSYGLKNIKERVDGMGGLLKVISFKGQGTSIEIKVPMIKEETIND